MALRFSNWLDIEVQSLLFWMCQPKTYTYTYVHYTLCVHGQIIFVHRDTVFLLQNRFKLLLTYKIIAVSLFSSSIFHHCLKVNHCFGFPNKSCLFITWQICVLRITLIASMFIIHSANPCISLALLKVRANYRYSYLYTWWVLFLFHSLMNKRRSSILHYIW